MNIITDFGMDPERVRAARYAAELARSLRTELVLRTGERRTDRDMIERAVSEHLTLDPTQLVVVGMNTHIAGQLAQGAIYVAAYRETARLDALPKGTQVLFCHEENGLVRKEGQTMKICLPFGDQIEPARAHMRAVLPIAKALDATVVGVHATYRDPQNPSTAPREHMNRAARETQSALAELASFSRVTFSTHIGMGCELVPFVTQSAIDLDCTLLAVSHGRALRDSYAHEIEKTTNLPTLFLNLSTEGGAR